MTTIHNKYIHALKCSQEKSFITRKRQTLLVMTDDVEHIQFTKVYLETGFKALNNFKQSLYRKHLALPTGVNTLRPILSLPFSIKQNDVTYPLCTLHNTFAQRLW